MTKLILKRTRYSGNHTFFCKKFQNIHFSGNSRNGGGDGGGDGVLNSNHRGTGRGKTARDLGEWVPRVPRGIPRNKHFITLKGLWHINFIIYYTCNGIFIFGRYVSAAVKLLPFYEQYYIHTNYIVSPLTPILYGLRGTGIPR